MIWIVAYDIADDRRRLRVARILQRHGVRVQRSVFECTFTATEHDEVMGVIGEFLEAGSDLIQAFPLCERCSAARTSIGDACRPLDEPFIVF